MLSRDQALYPYQQQAMTTMARSNVLLAYDMGVGKTPTTIAAIETMREQGDVSGWGTVLVPSSLKWQWAGEVAKFSDTPALVVDGSPASRAALYREHGDYGSYDGYLVMSYDTWVKDIEWGPGGPGFANEFMVLDEATAIKGFRSKRSKVLKKYRSKYDVRLALTGTPIENGQLEEIFSLFQWIDPDVLGPWPAFEARYIERNALGWITGYRNLDEFHKRIRPYVLRKTADDPDVATYMPKVVHRPPEWINLDKRTRHVYDVVAGMILDRLEEVGTAPAREFWRKEDDPDHPDGELMSMIQVARMLLDHPIAVLESAARFEDPTTDTGSAFAARITTEGWLDGLVRSPKLEQLEQYVKDYFSISPEGSKIVIFCSFVDVAHKIAYTIPDSVVFTGELTSKQKDAVKRQFMDDPDTKVFVSTDAGGYGLDLPVANLLINYDLPWTSGMLKQRNARIRRASTTWGHVVVQDFITLSTIEERLRDKLDYKDDVASAVVDGKKAVLSEEGDILRSVGSLRSFLEDLL